MPEGYLLTTTSLLATFGDSWSRVWDLTLLWISLFLCSRGDVHQRIANQVHAKKADPPSATSMTNFLVWVRQLSFVPQLIVITSPSFWTCAWVCSFSRYCFFEVGEGLYLVCPWFWRNRNVWCTFTTIFQGVVASSHKMIPWTKICFFSQFFPILGI